MTDKQLSLGGLTASIRSKSDALVSVRAEAGALEAVKVTQTRIRSVNSQLTERIKTFEALRGFLVLEAQLDWTDVRKKLATANKWLSTEMTNWNVAALNELLESLRNMSDNVMSSLDSDWKLVLTRIGRVRTLLGFLDDIDAKNLVKRSGLFRSDTTPVTMLESVGFLTEAEKFVADNGVGNDKVQMFLEDASSDGGASLESMNEPDVKSWLDEKERRLKFGIVFKDRGH
jgi:hypothetical protein